MKREEILKKKIESYIKKGQLLKNKEYAKLEKLFLKKSRKNFTIANLFFNISNEEELKKVLKIPSDFEAYEWVIIVSYYSMYTAALSTLAKLEFKSKSHAATIAVLEYEYLHKQKELEDKHIENLTKAYNISEELITKLIKTKTKRENAQYEATPEISKQNSKEALADAEEFITKIEEILD